MEFDLSCYFLRILLKTPYQKYYITHINKDKNFTSSDILTKENLKELAIFKDLSNPFYLLSI